VVSSWGGDDPLAQLEAAKERTRARRRRRRAVLAWVTVSVLLLGAAGSAGYLVWRSHERASDLVSVSEPAASATPRNVTPSAPPTAAPPSASPQVGDGGVPAAAVAALMLRAVDGDTIDTDLGRVRLHGIDTPEVGEPYSEEATGRLAQLLPVGATVWLWRSPGSDDVDRYGRLVRTVFTSDGRDAGSVLVAEGLAAAYTEYSDAYVEQESDARRSSLGIWSGAAALSMPGSAAGGAAASGSSAEPWNEPGPDLDCADIGVRVQITGPDYHRLDRDGDGWACESYGSADDSR